ncbi:MAG: hypothetical protein QW512_00790 [Thermofilaceae archaeon]
MSLIRPRGKATADSLLRHGYTLRRIILRSVKDITSYATAAYDSEAAKAYFIRASRYALQRISVAMYVELVQQYVNLLRKAAGGSDIDKALAYISAGISLILISYREKLSHSASDRCIVAAVEAIETLRDVKC